MLLPVAARLCKCVEGIDRRASEQGCCQGWGFRLTRPPALWTQGEEVGLTSGYVGFASTLHPAGGVSSLDAEHQGFEGGGEGGL